MLGVRGRCIEAFVYFVGFAGKEGKGEADDVPSRMRLQALDIFIP